MRRWQIFIAIAQVILAKLTRGIAKRLQQFGDRCVLCLESHLGHPRAEAALSGDEGRAPCGAALLPIGVGETHPFFGDAIDTYYLLPHSSHW